MAANNPGPAATGLMQLEADIDVDDMQRRVDLITSNHTVRDAICTLVLRDHYHGTRVVNPPVVQLLVALGPTLKELKLTGGIHDLAEARVSMSGLEVLTYGELDRHEATLVPTVFPNIKKLCCRAPNDIRHLAGIRGCHNLKALSLSNIATRFMYREMAGLYEIVPDIETLIIRDQLDGIQVSSLVASFARFKNLRGLAISTHQYVEYDMESDNGNDNDNGNGNDNDNEEDDDVEHEGDALEYEDDDSFQTAMADWTQEAKREKLKNEHELNEDPRDMAKLYFETIDKLEALCLAAFRHSRVFKAERDQYGALVGDPEQTREKRVRFLEPDYTGETFWDNGLHSIFPAINTADLRSWSNYIFARWNNPHYDNLEED